MTTVPTIEAWLTDMDGVLVREGEAIPGAAQFLDRLKQINRPFLVLTGSTLKADIEHFPYRPKHVVDSIGDIVDYV